MTEAQKQWAWEKILKNNKDWKDNIKEYYKNLTVKVTDRAYVYKPIIK